MDPKKEYGDIEFVADTNQHQVSPQPRFVLKRENPECEPGKSKSGLLGPFKSWIRSGPKGDK